jgi:hypothetical protein
MTGRTGVMTQVELCHPGRDSHGLKVRLTSSSQVKLCPDECPFKVGNMENRWVPKPTCIGDRRTFPKWNVAACLESTESYSAWRGESHTIAKETERLFCPQRACNKCDVWERPVFQVDHQADRLQMCSFWAHTWNHVTFNSTAFCRILQQRLKFRVLRLECTYSKL